MPNLYLYLLVWGLFFYRIPNSVHFGEGHFVQLFAVLRDYLFHSGKSGYKFLVCFFEGFFGVYIQETGIIDERKQDIAQFFLGIMRVVLGNAIL